jgi:signal transduction histidine kinase
LEARILYWGPSASGKTETLAALHRTIDPEGRSTLYCIASEDGSTAYFDILGLDEFRFGGQRVRISVCSTPGGVDRTPERRALLREADAIVFVADAGRSSLPENRACARELEATLEKLGRRRDEVPVVWSFNKQDGGDCIATRELREMVVPGTDPVYETVASEGNGVFESFRETFRLLLQNLARRHGLEPEPEDRDGLPEQLLPQLVRQNGRRAARTRVEDERVVSLPVSSGEMPDAERAVETMLEMAARHAEQAEKIRMVEARNIELMAVNRVARSILSAMEIDNLLVVLLDATTERLGVTHAGVVMFDPTRDGALRTHVTGFGKDPALGLEPSAARRFFDIMRASDGPIPADPSRNPDLFRALTNVDRRVTGAIFQPVKLSATTPSGWMSLYFVEEPRHLGAQGLLFLSSISRLASLGLEKIAQHDAMARDHEVSESERAELNAKLEMAQARVRAQNRGIETRVRERTKAMEEKIRRLKQDSAEAARRARSRGMEDLADSFAREVHKPVLELAGRLEEMRTGLDALRTAARSDEADERLEILSNFDQLIEDCLRSAERVESVTSSLRQLSGRGHREREGFALNAAVADAVTLLERRLEGCAELELRLGKVPDIVGNEADLRHVVTAILTNALEAVERSGMRGTITVTTYTDDEGATLRVSDNGAGIEPELLPKVCEPFVTTKPREPGSGLGLHAANAALEAQGGNLRISSKPGEGTTVTAVFALPVSDPEPQTTSSPDAEG